MCVDAALEGDALTFAPFCHRHGFAPTIKTIALPSHGQGLTQVKASLANNG
jgi:hypothetical protein